MVNEKIAYVLTRFHHADDGVYETLIYLLICSLGSTGKNLIYFIFMKSELFYFYFQIVNLPNYCHHDWPEMLFNSRIYCSDSFSLT